MYITRTKEISIIRSYQWQCGPQNITGFSTISFFKCTNHEPLRTTLVPSSPFCVGQILIGHVRYINILTWLRGFRVKIVNFLSFFCLSIPKRDSNTKKTIPNIEVWHESLGAMLEYWYIERDLLPIPIMANYILHSHLAQLLRYLDRQVVCW